MPIQQDITTLLEQAVQFRKEDNYQQVIELLSDEILEDNKSAALYEERANAYFFLNQINKAIEDFNKIIELNPGNAYVHYNRGIEWGKKGEYDKAIDDYTKAIELKPDYADAYYNRGIEWGKKGEHNKAIDDYTKAIVLKADYVSAYYNRGIEWVKKDEHNKAIDDYTKAIELKANYVSAYYNRGIEWGEKEKYDKAIDDYTKAIELKPDYSDAYYNRAIQWRNKGENDKAIDDYTKAIELKPDYADAFNNRGIAWNDKKENEKAIVDYTKAIELKPDNADVYFNRGFAWQAISEYEKAIEDYTKTIELNPKDADAYNNRGLAWADNGEYEKAILDYTKAIELKSNDPRALRNRGNIYFEKLEDYEKAIIDYEKSVSLDSLYSFLQTRIDEAKLKIGQRIDEPGINEASSFVSDILDTISDENSKNKIREAATILVKCMNSIKNHTFISIPIPVAHYSKLFVADLMIMNDNAKMRYSNVVNMNDPEEGKVLINILKGVYKEKLNENDKEFEINEYFKETKLFKDGDARDNNIYLGSFLPAPENDRTNSHEDELVMWRTYGKDENKTEAAGCSIVIDAEFFYWPPTSDMREAIRAKDKKAKIPQKETEIGQILYRVLYYNRIANCIESKTEIKCEAIDADIELLKDALISLIQVRIDTTEKEKIDNIVYRVLSELRYFFKSSSYSFENEYRIIQYYLPDYKISNPFYQPGNNQSEEIYIVKCDDKSPTLPRTLYVESTKPIFPHIRKIYIGAKVPNPERWMYLEVVARQKNNYRLSLLPSSQKFQ